MSRFSIRARLTAWYAGVLAASLLLLGGLAYLVLKEGLHRDVDESLATVARTVADAARRRQLSAANPTLEELVRELFGAPPFDKLFQLLDPGGQPLTVSPNLRGRMIPLNEEALQNATLGLATYETIDLGERHPIRLLTYPVMEGGRLAHVLRVAISLESVNAALRTFLVVGAILLPAVTLLAGAGGFLLARRALRPVDVMITSVRRIEAANLDERIADPGTEDELGRLARTMNDMLDRLEGAFAEVRRFTADASHELRTPLTIVRGEVEVALRAVRDPAEYRKVLESCLEEANRMTRMVDNLLTLTRADAGQLSLERRPVEIGTLLARAVARGRPLGEGRGVSVSLTEGPPATVQGDPDRLEQVFMNLVDNGVKYTPAGGRVTVGWRLAPAGPGAGGRGSGVGGAGAAPTEIQQAPSTPIPDPPPPGPGASGRIVVHVEDTGIGISAADREQVFRRFYRVDRARSRAEGSSGLGLAIVQSIVEAHDGTVGVKSNLGHGSTFTITLPLAPAPLPIGD